MHPPYDSRAPLTSTAPDRVPYKPHRFSVEDYYRMAEVGILKEGDHVELIDGIIFVQEPSGLEHASRVDRMAYAFLEIAQARHAILRVQKVTVLDDYSSPEPDISLLEWRDDFYLERHPGPDDILLAVEVAWTSGRFDRKVKMPLYARTGVPEYWIVDLQKGFVEVWREPDDAGYESIMRYGPGASISPLAFSDVSIRVDDLLIPERK